jgi:hypothetical protein
MWPADVATRPHHEARENEGLLYASATAAGRDEEKATEHWYHDAKVDIRYPSDAGSNDSSTAQRRVYPGNLQLETRSSARLDWREVTIVSFILLFCTYTMSAPSIASPSRRLSVSSQHHCVASILIVLCHSLPCRACSQRLQLSISSVARQPTST